uniref:Origin recognition complex subunit 2 n=1 Tax=Pseudo-nitzschia multistriata TaxID=183589 RepID=A0A448ZGI7_9STRA
MENMATTTTLDSKPATQSPDVPTQITASIRDSLSSTMDGWFHTASDEECEVMTAKLLDYRFEGEDFRTEWWGHAEALGFVRVDYYHYRLPPSLGRFYNGEEEEETDVHTAQSLCRNLNTLAIPHGKSPLDRIGESDRKCGRTILERAVLKNRLRNTAFDKQGILDQWATLREELVFRKFHAAVTKDCKSNELEDHTRQQNGGKRGRVRKASLPPGRAASGEKRKLWSSSDAGAELFFRKGKRTKATKSSGKVSGGGNDDNQNTESEEVIDYPTTVQSYSDCARDHRLAEAASVRESNIADSLFDNWKFLISTNHSLLLYGTGSKKNLLERFANDDLDGDVIEINGFDPSLTVDGLLRLLIDHWLGGEEPTIRKNDFYHVHHETSCETDKSTAAARRMPFFPRRGDFRLLQTARAVAKRIAEEVTKTARPVTLIVHSMDAGGLGSGLAQEALSVLVSQSRTGCGLNAVRLVASIDHVRGQIVVESLSRHGLHWLQMEVHTHRPYVDEVVPELALSERQSSAKKRARVASSARSDRDLQHEGMSEDEYLALEHESIFSVLKSLSSTHSESLRQLAWLHLESEQEWISYTDLLKRCRSERIVQADQQLRLYLGELLDHSILERSKNNVTTSYRIPYPEEILSMIWNFKRDS